MNSLALIPGVTYDRPERRWRGIRVVAGEGDPDRGYLDMITVA